MATLPAVSPMHDFERMCDSENAHTEYCGLNDRRGWWYRLAGHSLHGRRTSCYVGCPRGEQRAVRGIVKGRKQAV